MTQEEFKALPRIVQQVCELFDCMIVGSTVDGKQSDIDIICPFRNWSMCGGYLNNYTKNIGMQPTSFGGWRFRDPESDRDIDIWPQELEGIAKSCRPSNIYWPKHHLNIRLEW